MKKLLLTGFVIVLIGSILGGVYNFQDVVVFAPFASSPLDKYESPDKLPDGIDVGFDKSTWQKNYAMRLLKRDDLPVKNGPETIIWTDWSAGQYESSKKTFTQTQRFDQLNFKLMLLRRARKNILNSSDRHKVKTIKVEYKLMEKWGNEVELSCSEIRDKDDSKKVCYLTIPPEANPDKLKNYVKKNMEEVEISIVK